MPNGFNLQDALNQIDEEEKTIASPSVSSAFQLNEDAIIAATLPQTGFIPVRGVNSPMDTSLNAINTFLDQKIKEDEQLQDEFSFVDDVLLQVVGGGRDALQNISDLTERGINFTFSTEVDIPDLPEVEQSNHIAGGLVRSGTQFLTAFIPVLGLAGRVSGGIRSLSGLQQIIAFETSAVIAEQLAFDPQDPRLSNFIEQFPELQNPITEFLQADPNDPEAVARLKMSMEGLALGGIFNIVFRGLSRIKFSNKFNTRNLAEGTTVEDLIAVGNTDQKFEGGNIDLSELTEQLTEINNTTGQSKVFEFNSDQTQEFIPTTVEGIKQETPNFNLFAGEAVEQNIDNSLRPNSSETISTLSVKEILDLAAIRGGKRRIDIFNTDEVNSLVRQLEDGQTFDQLPTLGFKITNRGNSKVTLSENIDQIAALVKSGRLNINDRVPVVLRAPETFKFGETTQRPTRLFGEGKNNRNAVDFPDSIVYPKSTVERRAFLSTQRLKASGGTLDTKAIDAQLRSLRSQDEQIDFNISVSDTPKQVDELVKTIREQTGQNISTGDIIRSRMLRAYGVGKGKTNKATANNITPFMTTSDRIVANIFNESKFADNFQDRLTGVDVAPEALRDVAKGKITPELLKESNIGLVSRLPGFQFSGVRAFTLQRVEEFLKGTPRIPTPIKSRFGSTLSTGSQNLTQILKPLADKNQAENFLLYVSALRAQHLAGRNIETRLGQVTKPAELNRIIEEGNRTEGFKESLLELTKFTDSVLDYLSSAGRLNSEQISKFKTENPVYIPFFVDPKNLPENIVGSKGSVSNSLKGIKGNTDIDLMTPIDALVRYTTKSIMDAEANMAKESFYSLLDAAITAERLPIDQIARRITSRDLIQNNGALSSSILNALKGEMRRQMGDADLEFDLVIKGKGEDVDEILDKNDLDGLLKVATFRNPFTTSDGRIFDIVYRDGEAQIYEIFDKDLFDMYKAVGFKNAEETFRNLSVFKPFRDANRFVRQTVTLAPNFAVFNAIRDTVSASINSSFLFLPFYHTFKGFGSIMKDVEGYRQALSNGLGAVTRVETEGFDINTLDVFFQDKTKTGRQLSALFQGFKNSVLAKGFDGYRELITGVENASRIAEYNLAIKNGLDPFGAAFSAREVSTNFFRRGSNQLVRGMNDVSLFFNAGLQGMYRTARKFKKEPKKAILGSVALLGMYDFAMNELASQYPEHNGFTTAIKDFNYLIPNFADHKEALKWVSEGMPSNNLPELNPEMRWIALPKSYDYGTLAGLVSQFLRSVDKGTAVPISSAFNRAFGTVAPSFGAPTLVKPFFELNVTNKNWVGNPIIPDYLKDLPNQDIVRDSTSNAAIRLAHLTQYLDEAFFKPEGRRGEAWFSPIAADHVVDSLLTGIMAIGVDSVDFYLRDRERGEAPVNPKSQRIISGNPVDVFLSDFTRRFHADSTKIRANVNRYFELKKRVEGEVRSQRSAIESYRRATFMDDFDNPESKALRALSPTIRKLDEYLRVNRKAIRLIQNSKTLSGKEKRKRIDQHILAMDDAAKRFLLSVENSPSLDVIWETILGTSKKLTLE